MHHRVEQVAHPRRLGMPRGVRKDRARQRPDLPIRDAVKAVS